MLDNWQRVERIIKWAGLASVSALAREIGLNRSENLYQIKRGNNGISREMSRAINDRFPELSRAWLLTGEGAMLRSDPAAANMSIPFFKTDAIRIAPLDIHVEGAPKPDYYISFPAFNGCSFAAITMSDSMAPDITRGSILFFAPVEVKAAVPGEMHLVVSPQFSGIRFLRRAPGSGQVRLVPSNKKDFDEILIAEDDIEQIFAVRGIVNGKGI